MNEIYWLSRLDSIVTAFGVLAVVFGIAVISLAMLAAIDGKDELLMEAKRRDRLLRNSTIAFIIACIGLIFVPSSKEAMAIWGIGQTVDYIKENETLSGLPDKCVEALDAWLDSVIGKE